MNIPLPRREYQPVLVEYCRLWILSHHFLMKHHRYPIKKIPIDDGEIPINWKPHVEVPTSCYHGHHRSREGGNAGPKTWGAAGSSVTQKANRKGWQASQAHDRHWYLAQPRLTKNLEWYTPQHPQGGAPKVLSLMVWNSNNLEDHPVRIIPLVNLFLGKICSPTEKNVG